jgi:hypothetical protein
MVFSGEDANLEWSPTIFEPNISNIFEVFPISLAGEGSPATS